MPSVPLTRKISVSLDDEPPLNSTLSCKVLKAPFTVKGKILGVPLRGAYSLKEQAGRDPDCLYLRCFAGML